MEKHQKIATVFYLVTIAYIYSRDGKEIAINAALTLGAALIAIYFYRLLAILGSFGFPEYFAKDYGSKTHPAPYAFLCWVLFLIASALFLFF